MTLLFFSCLYFYIAINPVRSSDRQVSTGLDIFSVKPLQENPNFENCTDCSVKPGPPCVSGLICLDCYADKGCVICCASSPQCCYCPNYACWNDNWQLMTMTHISLSIMFVLGIIAIIIIYFKMCTRFRTSRMVRARCALRRRNDATLNCSTIEGLSERPPPYSETYDAPPLYTSPYNRASMEEPPPTYPGTPKPQERFQRSNDTPTIPVATQHM